jgi:hypothetical protein
MNIVVSSPCLVGTASIRPNTSVIVNSSLNHSRERSLLVLCRWLCCRCVNDSSSQSSHNLECPTNRIYRNFRFRTRILEALERELKVIRRNVCTIRTFRSWVNSFENPNLDSSVQTAAFKGGVNFVSSLPNHEFWNVWIARLSSRYTFYLVAVQRSEFIVSVVSLSNT